MRDFNIDLVSPNSKTSLTSLLGRADTASRDQSGFNLQIGVLDKRLSKAQGKAK